MNRDKKRACDVGKRSSSPTACRRLQETQAIRRHTVRPTPPHWEAAPSLWRRPGAKNPARQTLPGWRSWINRLNRQKSASPTRSLPCRRHKRLRKPRRRHRGHHPHPLHRLHSPNHFSRRRRAHLMSHLRRRNLGRQALPPSRRMTIRRPGWPRRCTRMGGCPAPTRRTRRTQARNRNHRFNPATSPISARRQATVSPSDRDWLPTRPTCLARPICPVCPIRPTETRSKGELSHRA